jgi:predicted nucleic acid-binding protein
MSTMLVCNTGPLIAIAAATGDWQVLQRIPERIVVPDIVIRELEAGPAGSPGRGLIQASPWIVVHGAAVPVPAYLAAALDPGEAAVIALALQEGIASVAIDEQAARHVARTCGLHLTGSLGLLLRAQGHGAGLDLSAAIDRMRIAGIWISGALAAEVLRLGRQK